MTSFFNCIRIFFLALFFLLASPILKRKSVYYFLKFCGPTFIKLGQILSCRPDLIGDKMAEILANFQDKLPPSDFRQIKKTLTQAYGKNYQKIFLQFNKKPVASASIAQVHKAIILDEKGKKEIAVAVKILHPKIRKIFARDIATLEIIVKLIRPFSYFFHKTFSDIALLLKETSRNELDLLREAAAASKLKENLKNAKGFIVPQVHWHISSESILVTDWIDGIPFSNKTQIAKTTFNKKTLAKNLVNSYFEQVYENGFFHADMHPGNLFLTKKGEIAVVDFGIIGIIDKQTRIAVAEILMSFLQEDYTKIAKIHINAGLIPANTNIEDFALSCRIIGKSIVGNSIKDISLAKLLGNLLKMTKEYKMQTRPELLLLQKTLMLIEGVGLMLDEDLNMWDLARPWMKNWAKRNIGFDAKIRDHLFENIKHLKNLGNLNDKVTKFSSQKNQINQELQQIKSDNKKLKLALFSTLIIITALVLTGCGITIIN